MNTRFPEPTATRGIDVKSVRVQAIRDFVVFVIDARWHSFPVSVKEFQALERDFLKGDQ